MTAKASVRKVDAEYVCRLRANIEDRITDVSSAPTLRKREALQRIKRDGISDLTSDKLAYILKNRLVTPKVLQGDARDTHLYGRDHIRDIILVHTLRTKDRQSYTRIANLLREASEIGVPTLNAYTTPIEVGVPSQRQRGLSLLRSRVMGIVLKALVGEYVSRGLVVHIRQRQKGNTDLPRDTFKVTPKKMSLREADQYVGNFRGDDLVGHVAQDNEVLFPPHNYTSLVDVGYPAWLLLSIEFGQPARLLELMVGWPAGLAPEGQVEIFVPLDSDDGGIFALLLAVTRLEAGDTASSSDRPVGNQADHSTPLRSLAEVIPDLSPAWGYCAILTEDPKQPNKLRLSAMSKDFPRHVRSDVTVEPGQPLTGWAFKWNLPIVVQHTTGSDDPRLAYQSDEKATAAAAVPTHVRGTCNGVLYVATRFDLSDYEEVFSQAELKVLRVLANIVGETIERNRIRVNTEAASYQIIREPGLDLRPWADLKVHLRRALESAADDPIETIGDNENLHLTLIRVEGYDQLRREDPAIADWAAQHIVATTQKYFLSVGFDAPSIFLRHANSRREFACLIPHLLISDKEDRDFRDHLRELLSSLELQFSYHDRVRVTSYVWSMPFRLTNLHQKLGRDENPKSAIDRIIGEIIREAEEALVALPRIEAGHKHEAEMAYAAALADYVAARISAPDNRYLIRHVAKTLFATGDLDRSAHWWKILIDKDPVPRHYARYAYVLAAQGKYSLADKNYEKAYALDQENAAVLLEWGDLLLLQGKVDEAIRKYEAALNLQEENQDVLWLRLAEAYLAKGERDKAKEPAQLVLGQKPEDRDARRLMLRILHSA